MSDPDPGSTTDGRSPAPPLGGEVGKVLGTQDATPLDFWVAIDDDSYLQLDDVVGVATEVPGAGRLRISGVVDMVRARHEGSRFDSDVFLADQGLLAAQAALSAASDALAEAAAAAQAAAVEATRAHADLEAAEREHERAEQALHEAAGDRDAALALLRDHFGDDVPDDARTRLEQSVAELTGAEDQAGATRTALDGAREALKSADDAVREATAALTAIDLRLGELRATAQAALGELDRIDAETRILNVPEPDAARDLRASTLSAWCGRTARSLHGLAAAEAARAAALVEQLLSLAVDAAPQDAASALSALEAAEREAVGARVRAEEAAANLADRVGQRADLEARLAVDDQRIAVLSVLAKELRADHFIEFVLQETLDLLAGHASEELLRISDDRYSLVSQDGEFSVVDHVNADEQRSVKTLSGGETFMASLSLALALSKHVTELAGEGLGTRLEAVFIDEGFGSLDPETLEEVIDALERLREEDLLIGVISHVPALAERLTTGLRVQKDGNRSFVLASA